MENAILPETADILENDILRMSPELLSSLLKDHTMSRDGAVRNIFWATSDYERLGEGYGYYDPILPDLITGNNGQIIKPRVLKNKGVQSARVRDMAEVFTPPWVCNAQNNLIDEAWFGRKDVFNTEYTADDGTRKWKTASGKIPFSAGRTWKDYVRDNRLEITCGEAPYIISRYDTSTGEAIPLEQRIGMLDRKLRIVSENTETPGEWSEWAQEAYKSIYAYEWQGDNLLIARESMLYSFIEYYRAKFGEAPPLKAMSHIAHIISWNVWQMDGLKGVVPGSCGDRRTVAADLFGETETISRCRGCKTGGIFDHNGAYCVVRDWNAPKEKQKIRFVDLLK